MGMEIVAMLVMNRRQLDPYEFAHIFWPRLRFYDKQRMIIDSALNDPETYVHACHQVGKDYVSAFIALYAFLVNPVARIITTSVKDDHLRVLWGEIGRFIDTAKYPLKAKDGGMLVVNHREIKKVITNEYGVKEVCKISYLKGMVSAKGEGLQGHHAPFTMLIIDEASGVDDEVFGARTKSWAKHILAIGNPYPCTNSWMKGCEEGTVRTGGEISRRVIHIEATDSPNVRMGMRCRENGKILPKKYLLPGLLTLEQYYHRLATWDEIQRIIGLEGRFYKGKDVLMFPPDWLDYSNRAYLNLPRLRREAKGMGIDPGEGEADTAWAVVDEYGILDLIDRKTPDTSDIEDITINIGRKWNLSAEQWQFDRGGGGKQIADRLRKRGYKVKTAAFGGGVTPLPKIGRRLVVERIDVQEEQTTYLNRRCQMYDQLRQLLNPNSDPLFAISAEYTKLRAELAPIPLRYDAEGRIRLPSKNKRDANDKQETLSQIIGWSPDRADALVLAVDVMLTKKYRVKAGAG